MLVLLIGAYRRISGSCLGGGSFFGLCKLLTGQSDFDNIIEMSRRGDVQNVDLLVSDIYGILLAMLRGGSGFVEAAAAQRA